MKGWIAAVGAKGRLHRGDEPVGERVRRLVQGQRCGEPLDREVFPSPREAHAPVGPGRSLGRAPGLRHRLRPRPTLGCRPLALEFRPRRAGGGAGVHPATAVTVPRSRLNQHPA